MKIKAFVKYTLVLVVAVVMGSMIHPVTASALEYQFLFKFGSNGTGTGQLQYPYGVAVDSANNIVVADTGNNRIQVFDSSGVFLREVGYGELYDPWGVAVDSANNIVVADTGNNRIQVFDSSGVFLRGFDGELYGPFGVAVDSADNIVVADVLNNRIRVFDSSGVFLREFGSYGSGDGEFLSYAWYFGLIPLGVAVDSANNIVVADAGNNRIQVFDSTGVFLRKFGSLGSGDGEFNGPSRVAVDSANNIVVADTGNNRIQVFGLVVTTPTPTASPTPTPTAAVTPTPFPEPSPEPSPSPVIIPTPEASPTPQVSPSPTPTEPPTAITLLYFKARANGDGSVGLTWETATEVDNAGFNIYRSRSEGGQYTKINDKLIAAKGNATSGARYKFADTSGEGKSYYKLEDVDYNGVSTMHGPVGSKKAKRLRR